MAAQGKVSAEQMLAEEATPIFAPATETPPASSEELEDMDSELDEEIEAPASPSSGKKKNERRTRRRRRHGKKAGASSTSTASTASGGNRSSEDDSGERTPKSRGVVTWRDMGLSMSPDEKGERVVTWRDLGLGMGLGGKKSKRQQASKLAAPAMARCEIAAEPSPPASCAPEAFGDASARVVPPASMRRPHGGGQWITGMNVQSPTSPTRAAHPGW